MMEEKELLHISLNETAKFFETKHCVFRGQTEKKKRIIRKDDVKIFFPLKDFLDIPFLRFFFLVYPKIIYSQVALEKIKNKTNLALKSIVYFKDPNTLSFRHNRTNFATKIAFESTLIRSGVLHLFTTSSPPQLS